MEGAATQTELVPALYLQYNPTVNLVSLVTYHAQEHADMEFDRTCRYQESHEWIRIEGAEAVIGISDYAQSELNDVVYVELPEAGDTLNQGDEFGSVESVKASSELYMPMGGEVIAINEALDEEPELVNSAPFGGGWMLRIRLADPGEASKLLDAAGYRALVE